MSKIVYTILALVGIIITPTIYFSATEASKPVPIFDPVGTRNALTQSLIDGDDVTYKILPSGDLITRTAELSSTTVPFKENEIPELRTPNSFTVLNPNGTRTTTFSSRNRMAKVGNIWYKVNIKFSTTTDIQLATSTPDIVGSILGIKTARAQTTTNYFSQSYDGAILKTSSSVACDSTRWAEAHDAASGGSVQTTSANALFVSVYCQNSPRNFQITRGYLNFDTSALPDNANISSSTVSVNYSNPNCTDNGTHDFFVVVQAINSSDTITTADYDLMGDAVSNPTQGSQKIDCSASISGSSGYIGFNLNATGMTWINLTGTTRLSIREGHDVDNVALPNTGGKADSFQIYFSEQTGTSQDPYLAVTYTTPAAAAEINTDSLFFKMVP